MKHVVVFVAIWDRPKVVEIFKAGIDRLTSSLKDKYTFEVVSVVSNKDDQQHAERLGFKAHPTSNKLLGRKMNTLVQYALNFKADYYVQMGSDNLVSAEWLEQAFEQIDNGADMVADRRLYFISPYRWEACTYTYWTPTLNRCGAARVFSKSCLDMVKDEMGNVQMWPESAEKGLDGLSEQVLIDNGANVEDVNLGKDKYHLVDIKSETNIWPFERFKNQSNGVTVSEATWFCSDKEIELIYNYGNLR